MFPAKIDTNYVKIIHCC